MYLFCSGIDEERRNAMVTMAPSSSSQTQPQPGTSTSNPVVQMSRSIKKRKGSDEKQMLDREFAVFFGRSTCSLTLVEDKNLQRFLKLLNPEVSFILSSLFTE